MRSIKTRLVCTAAALAVAAAAPAASPATPVNASPSAIVAKPCSAGFTHAVMPDRAHKCLRAGQFCSHKRGWQRAYHRYGFHCRRNGHLTYY
jgi:hypothetical protein